MEEHKEEVYERIPWEEIGPPGRERQWWMLGLAAFLVAGALGYSFMSNRPVPLAAPATDQTAPTPTPPQTIDPAPPVAPMVPPSAPAAVAEADLYAMSPTSLTVSAENHALWFVREFLSYDGSDQEDAVLRLLLPSDVPMPTGTSLVFVEWVAIHDSAEVSPGIFRVGVVARYLSAVDGGEYERKEPILVSVDVDISGVAPAVVLAPTISTFAPEQAPPLGLAVVPEEIAAIAAEMAPGSEVVGGTQRDDGSWDLVLLASRDGISRPVGLTVAP